MSEKSKGALASASSGLISRVRSSKGVVSEIAGEEPAASTTMSKAQRLAYLHQLSAAEEAGSVRYGLSRHPALVIAIKDRTAIHQSWAARYAAYAREMMGIADGDQIYG